MRSNQTKRVRTAQIYVFVSKEFFLYIKIFHELISKIFLKTSTFYYVGLILHFKNRVQIYIQIYNYE